MSQAKIRVCKLKKGFADKQVLDGVDLEIMPGESMVVIGMSGSGKSVLMKCILGLLRPDGGQVLVDGEDWCALPEEEQLKRMRKIGMVFQGAALFDSLPVWENVAFSLLQRRMSRRQAKARAAEVLELVGLHGVEDKMPAELSGGMAKRVALARALAMDPEIVFFDEPTSGLDPISAGVITTLIRDLSHKMRMTSVVVTHDVEAGLKIADHVVLLWQGKVIAEGDAKSIRESTDARVRQFIEGRPDGPIPFSRSTTAYLDDLLHKPGTVRLEP